MLAEDFNAVLAIFRRKNITCFDLKKAEAKHSWLAQIIQLEKGLDELYSRWKTYPFDIKASGIIKLNAYIRRNFYNMLSLFYIFKMGFKIYVFGGVFALEIRGVKSSKKYEIDWLNKKIIFSVINLSDAFELFLEIAKVHTKQKITTFARSRNLNNKITLHIIKRGHRALGYCKLKRPYPQLAFKWQIIFIEECYQETLLSHELAHLRISNHSKAFWKHHDFLLGKNSKEADMQMCFEMKRYLWFCNP